MTFAERFHALSKRLAQAQATVSTEEATKHALILPVIQALGYDVFNPQEVLPEYTADVGTKKGEKIDYAILRGSQPIILIECKAKGEALDMRHGSQLFRYFATLQTRIAVLTNGIVYQFYSDLNRANVMDTKPFLELNILDLSATDIANLEKISKEAFDLDGIVSTASGLVQVKALREVLAELLAEPDVDFVKHMAGRVTDKMLTKAVIEQFRGFVCEAFTGFVNERLNYRLRQAMAPDAVVSLASAASAGGGCDAESAADEDAVLTTHDELMGFFAVKSVLGGLVAFERVFVRDSKSCCAVLLDDNNRKPICRLFFNGKSKSLGLFDKDKAVTRVPIQGIDDIYKHADAIRTRVQAMLTAGDDANVEVAAGEA